MVENGNIKGREQVYNSEELVSDSMLNSNRERREHVSEGKASAMQA